MQLAAQWKVGVLGVALASAVLYFATTRVTPSEIVPALELGVELEPQPSDAVARGPLDADRGAIARVGQVLSSPHAIDAVLVDQERTQDLGFGVSRRRLSMYGGDGSCSVTLLYVDHAVARADALCWYDREAWDKVGRFLARSFTAAKLTLEAQEHVVLAKASVEYAGAKHLRAKLDDALGTLTRVTGTEEELAAYATLAGAGELELGTHCGIAGAETEGGRAQRTLVEAGRHDLLRNALHGPNPEGRGFAWQGLEALGKVSAADRAVMSTLAGLPIQIETCGGCMMHSESSSSVFVSR